MRPISRTQFLSLMLLTCVGVLSTILISCSSSRQTVGNPDEVPFVAVTQMMENSALNAVRDGVKDALAEAGYEAGQTLRWEWYSAQGNPVKAAQIADKYAWAKPDVIVAIAAPSAQSVVAAARNTPIIFSAVSDPVGVKLVKTINRPGDNVSGVSDRPPVPQQLTLIKEILPEATRLGVIYSGQEDLSAGLALLIDENAAAQGLEIQEATVTAANEGIGNEATVAARSLIGAVDAIYVLSDNLMILASVIQVGQDNQVPVFARNTDAVKQGAIAAISFNYYDVGRQTGAMVIKVLKGNRPSDLSVEFVEDLMLSVNLAAAEAMGIQLPESVISRADEVLSDEALSGEAL
ncbi:MAG: ABC transporter substrate-binding protein [Phormidesmis sp.]